MRRPRPSISRTRPQEINAFTKAVGARLRVERTDQRISLGDVSTATGVGYNRLRWHEAGAQMLRADELAGVAKVLRVDPQILMVPHYEDRAEPNEELRLALGKRMQAERAHAGLHQMEVVRLAGVTIWALQQHESGAESMRVCDLIRVAQIFKIDPAELIRV